MTQISNDSRPKLPYLATDGSRVHLMEQVGSRHILAQVYTAGGETILIPTPSPNLQVKLVL